MPPTTERPDDFLAVIKANSLSAHLGFIFSEFPGAASQRP